MSSVINQDRFKKVLDYKATFEGDPTYDVESFTGHPIATYLSETRAAVQASVCGNVIAYQLPEKSTKVVDVTVKPADAWLASLIADLAADEVEEISASALLADYLG